MIKEIFDIENYRGNYCMHCDTVEKAKVFLKYLDGLGLTWIEKDSYLENTRWDHYKEDTVYYFSVGMYGNINIPYPLNFEVIILNFDDFDWSKYEN